MFIVPVQTTRTPTLYLSIHSFIIRSGEDAASNHHLSGEEERGRRAIVVGLEIALYGRWEI